MFLKVLAKIEKAGIYISAALIFIMMVLTVVDTFLRDAFDRPIAGVYELSSMMIVGVLYLGMSYVQSQRRHITMDLLSTKLGTANKLFLQSLADVIFFAITALIAWKMGVETWIAVDTGDFLYGIIRFPTWPGRLAITLGTAALSLRLIADIVRNPLWLAESGFSRSRRYFSLAATILIFVLIFAGVNIIHSLGLPPVTIGWIGIGFFLVLLTIGVPAAASMAFVGVYGIWMLIGVKSALGIAGTVPFSSASEYIMTVLPLFIIMGIFAAMAGFAEKGFDLARRWLEGITGGIVHASIIGATIFGAASGSGAATCAVLGKIAIPEMIKQGVKKNMAIGVVASAATLDLMIPPSTTFVIYAMLTGNSIGKLLIAGIIPGLIGAAMIMLTVFIRCKLDPSLVQRVSLHRSSWKERFAAIPGAWGLFLIVFVVIGGIFTGLFTPTEAGSIGAFVAFLAVFFLKRKNRREIPGVLKESAGVSSSILFILVGGIMFGNMLSISRLPTMLSEWVVNLSIPPIAILIVIIFIYILLGTALDDMSILIVTIPVIYPAILKLGFDPIWFGVLMVQNMEIGIISPPYGMNLFVLKGILPDTSMGEIFSSVWWFIVPLVLTMAIYIAFPQVALWLPGLMSK
jgi:C4-dicarboxylate transporter DctM subunit